MTESKRLVRVHPDDEAHYPALFIAVFVDTGFMVESPLAWTRRGAAVVRRYTHDTGKGYDGIAVFEAACKTLDWADQPKYMALANGMDAARIKQKLRRLTGDATDKEEVG